jgi:hypothetical protein
VFDGRMSWPEAVSLAKTLTADPSSRVAAAVHGWDHPTTHEVRVLMDLYDLTRRANTDKRHQSRIKPYPRPWPDTNVTRSAPATVDQKTIRAALAARGH